MWVRRMFGLVAAIALATASVLAPVGAAVPVQWCTGPPSTTQSGRATLNPGLNGLATRQNISVRISLLGCSPSAKTRGAGILKGAFPTPSAQTCALITSPHVLTAPVTITWKNLQTSALSLTLSLTGRTRLVNVTGKVTSGLFAGHLVTGQFHFTRVVSPHGYTVAEACANTVAPGGIGRISVVALNLFTTQRFVIT